MHIGEEVIIDYKSTNNQDIIDTFEEQSNFEGYSRIKDFDDSFIIVEDCDYPIQLEYVFRLNPETNEWE